MSHRSLSSILFFSVVAALLFDVRPSAAQSADQNWPSFRGRDAQGIATGHSTPTEWNVEEGKNVKWKTPIPGLGHSCPVIWGDRIFVTTAVSGKDDPYLKVGLYGDIKSVEDDTEHKWSIYCLDKNTGELLWENLIYTGVPRIKRHTKASHANSTPATDGKHLVVMLGSEGLYCYDLDGKLLWKKDLGELDSGWYVQPSAQWGFGSSPIIYDGKVILQCDVQRRSFVAAYDVTDGRELWKTKRSEVPTWSTPAICKTADRTQVVCNGFKHIGGYDLETGKKLWKLKGGGDIPVPTPIVAHDLIYITNAHGMAAPLYAIRPNAKGVIKLTPGHKSEKYVGWFTMNNHAYMQTPLVYGDYLYSCRDSGVLACYNARTGEQIYRERLGQGRSGFTPSPVAADDKLYFTSEDGDVYVVKTGPEFEVLATNPMGEVCMATPAISEGTLFFRTKNHLVAIAEMPHENSTTVD